MVSLKFNDGSEFKQHGDHYFYLFDPAGYCEHIREIAATKQGVVHCWGFGYDKKKDVNTGKLLCDFCSRKEGYIW
jgi:hypothetical protein